MINKALLEQLREYGTIYANCAKSVPDEFLKELGVDVKEKIVSKNELSFALEAVKCKIKHRKDNVYVFSGLGDVHGGDYKRVIRNLMSVLVLIIYKVFGIKSVRIGRSIGEVTKSYGISEVLRSKFVTHNYVRDTQSLKRCKDMGMKNVELCPDMSWLYENKMNRKYNEGAGVVINLRGSTLGKYEEDYVKIISDTCGQVLEELQKRADEKLTVMFVYQVVEDKQITMELYNRYKDTYNARFIDAQLRLDDMENVYGKASFHISNRMHSLLLGYKYGSLPIAILDTNKHLKIAATFCDCKLEDLMLDIFEVRDVRERVGRIFEKRKDYYKLLLDCEDENCVQIKKILNGIMGNL